MLKCAGMALFVLEPTNRRNCFESLRPYLDPKIQNAIFLKSLARCIKCSRKINRITQMDCKSRDESNEPN